eukprot:1189817-Alexandrium_andersonii.AAC.1
MPHEARPASGRPGGAAASGDARPRRWSRRRPPRPSARATGTDAAHRRAMAPHRRDEQPRGHRENDTAPQRPGQPHLHA